MMKLEKTLFGLLALLILMAGFTGCDRTPDEEEEAEFSSEGEVFIDEFGPGVGFEAFADSYYAALDIDNEESYQGTSSLVITVPEEGSDLGWFAGGAFTHDIGRDLTEFNALTFWAKASRDMTINELGIGNDNTGTSLYVAQITGTPITTTWTRVVIPIPLPARLVEERGLFYFSEGHEDGLGCTIWLDEVQFETLDTILDPRPAIVTQTINAGIGGTIEVAGSTVTFEVDGTDQLVEADPGYFTFTSSDEAVVTVDEAGVITAVGNGTAAITARLGDVDATGVITVEVGVPSDGPTAPAPVPTQAEEDVISLYSNSYEDDVVIDTWSAVWDFADVTDIQIDGNDTKLYTNLVYAGIDFSSNTVDASAMTHFSLDIWTPDPTAAPARFKIKLVDFGPNGVWDGQGQGDDTEHELSFTAATDPALESETWISFDLQLDAFIGLASTEHIAQLVISGG
ncbi:Ig-like domain-containing protein, partial [bacterium]|nr:Ig-like domain-containing protein [bacterium]